MYCPRVRRRYAAIFAAFIRDNAPARARASLPNIVFLIAIKSEKKNSRVEYIEEYNEKKKKCIVLLPID